MDNETQESLSAGFRIAKLTALIYSRALNNPDDEEATHRARRASDFRYHAPFAELPTCTVEFPGNDQPSLQSPSGMTGGTGDQLLPNEIYHLIFAHVLDFEYAARQATLVSLSVTSKRFRSLAEPYLYARPRGAHSIGRQWMFLFSLVLEPERGLLVQNLEFVWYPILDNTDFLIDILHACPNVQDLQIQRGSSMAQPGLITRDDVSHMAAILAAAPRVTHFWFSTHTEWLSEDARHGDEEQQVSEMCAKDGRFAKFATQLQDLALHGQAEWLLRALVPKTSSALLSFTIGQSVNCGFDSQLLSSLSIRSPHLEYLEVRCPSVSVKDITQACRAWRNTLSNLRVHGVDEIDGWVGPLIEPLHALEHLHLGNRCLLNFRDLEAVAQSLPRQRFKSIGLNNLKMASRSLPAGSYENSWLTGGTGPIIAPDNTDPTNSAPISVDQVIASLILSHSSTLTWLDLKDGILTVGKPVLLSFRQASNLEELNVSLGDDVTSSDVDDLLDSCPKLFLVSQQIQERSSRPDRWAERTEERQLELDDEFARLPPSIGSLG